VPTDRITGKRLEVGDDGVLVVPAYHVYWVAAC
jgi:hypothetical protein